MQLFSRDIPSPLLGAGPGMLEAWSPAQGKVNQPEGKFFLSFSLSALQIQPRQKDWVQQHELLGEGGVGFSWPC